MYMCINGSDEKVDIQLIFPLQNPVLTPVGHHKLLFY